MAYLHELVNVHTEDQCAGPHCAIHNPSDHPLKEATLWFRVRAGILITERICECGIGHPDKNWLEFLLLRGESVAEVEAQAVHGCCGCCGDLTPEIEVLPGYFITPRGEVRSAWKSRGPHYGNEYAIDAGRRKPLKLRDNGRGYKTVNISQDGKLKDMYIHRLVWEAWRGPIPEGHQMRHLDGNKANNTLDNLTPGTQTENEADKDKHGTRPVGESHVRSKINDEELTKAVNLRKQGMMYKDIVEVLGLEVSYKTLWKRIDRLKKLGLY